MRTSAAELMEPTATAGAQQPATRQRPGHRCPAVDVDRRQRTGVTQREWCRRRAVAGVLFEPFTHRPAGLVPHRHRWFVATSPTGFVEAPHEVDVLTEPQLLVEAPDRVERFDAHHDGSTGHVADACAGPNACGLVAEVERRTPFAVHLRCDQSDHGIVEVPQQLRQPVGVGHRDVGIDERHQGGVDQRAPGVACSSGAPVRVEADRGANEWRIRSVVDRHPPVGVREPTELGRHHGHVIEREVCRRAVWMDRPSVSEAVGQPRRVDVAASLELLDDRFAAASEAEQPQWRPCEHDTSVATPGRVGVVAHVNDSGRVRAVATVRSGGPGRPRTR